jgi:hypothetical protein
VSSPTFSALKQAAAATLAGFTARNLANVIWGMAKLGHHPGDLLQAMCEEVGEWGCSMPEHRL